MKHLTYLDAGHVEETFRVSGSKGVYRDGKGYAEHHFNLDVTEQARDILREHGIDARITKQSYAKHEDLNARTDEVNAAKAKLLVSVHANAGSKDAHGACIFHWEGSEDFANIWTKNWKDAGTGVDLHGSGKHLVVVGTWTNLHMVRESAMPAYLIEHGFMTNSNDFKYIFGKKHTAYRRKAAETIAKSVCDYHGVKYESSKADGVDKPKKNTKAKPSKTKSSEPRVQELATSYKGLRVESIYKGSDKLNFYDSPRWDNPSGTFGYESGWTIDGKVKVDGTAMYRVKNSSGHTYYITASSDYVRVVKPKAKAAANSIAPSPTLRKGDRGERVKQLQRALNSIYFKCGKVDGIFGSNVEDAVRRFQSVYDPHGVDGIYGPRTQRNLQVQL
jgi:N-acetylmuramoyl-L-alanine amidase